MKLMRGVMVGASACALLLGGVVGTGSAAKAATAAKAAAVAAKKAPQCEDEALTYYPGSVGSPRYGEWETHILVCPKEDPSTWKKDSSVEFNATAANLGMTVTEEATIRVTETGSNAWNRFARYEARFQSKRCLPKVGWPCRGTGYWVLTFTVTADKKTDEVKVYPHRASGPDPFLVLYRTA